MLPILQDGDSVLREMASEVPASLFDTPELKKILEDMAETLDSQKDGVALAAPQVGISKRIFIVRYDRMSEAEHEEAAGPSLGVYINPTFLKSSKRKADMPEGCLSVRGLYGTTHRYEKATVRAQDEHGNWFVRGAGGILAQAFQHETDHLNGILFIDHATDLYRRTNEETSEETAHDTEQS